MSPLAERLASWAAGLLPTDDDLALAHRSLRDTVAVALAARDHPLRPLADALPDTARWAAVGHVLDFDDLHMASTAHISVVCVPATLACDGGATAYLAGAGVTARLGAALGWEHYTRGWHATCTAGAPGAAVAAGVALGLTREQLAHAIALAVPAAGGVQRAFGTDGKSLQVGFAAEAGVRAARLAGGGATADTAALDDWLELVGGDPHAGVDARPAVPGGLAVKLFPCCYALQRPISAVRELVPSVVSPADVARMRVRTSSSSIHPLIHDDPRTGLEGKFSLRYGIAAAVLDPYPDFASFTDGAVNRPEAREVMSRVEVAVTDAGSGLLDGEVVIEIDRVDGTTATTTLRTPPGAPELPPTAEQLDAKAAACGDDVAELVAHLDWPDAARLMRDLLPARDTAAVT